jgi:hypothetical protein
VRPAHPALTAAIGQVAVALAGRAVAAMLAALGVSISRALRRQMTAAGSNGRLPGEVTRAGGL